MDFSHRRKNSQNQSKVGERFCNKWDKNTIFKQWGQLDNGTIWTYDSALNDSDKVDILSLNTVLPKMSHVLLHVF